MFPEQRLEKNLHEFDIGELTSKLKDSLGSAKGKIYKAGSDFKQKYPYTSLSLIYPTIMSGAAVASFGGACYVAGSIDGAVQIFKDSVLELYLDLMGLPLIQTGVGIILDNIRYLYKQPKKHQDQN